MTLTSKQKRNIQNLDVETTIELLYECKERLGIVSQSEYVKIMDYQYSRQQLNNEMKSGKVKFINWCGVKHPYVNEK